MKALRWTIGFCFTVLAVAFAVTNRETVSVFWSPFHNAFEGPLYLVVLTLMAIGFLTGGLIVWINTLPVRRNARQLKKRVTALEKELEAIKLPPVQEAPRPYINPAPINQNVLQQQPAAIDHYKN
jgi:uncharacterized integral membrane protein